MRGTLVINGEPWRVIRVRAGDPRLIDRTGSERLATTDPRTRVIAVSEGVQPPMLDRVLLHEVAHAITVSWGLLGAMRSIVSENARHLVEEWAVQLMEGHALEAIAATSGLLGRPVCIDGLCSEDY